MVKKNRPFILLTADTRPGTFSVSCQACLENPRAIAGEDKFGNVEAILFASRAVNHTCMIPCSLRFSLHEGSLCEGIYDISANVCLALHAPLLPY
jgi:hypothetical protein